MNPDQDNAVALISKIKTLSGTNDGTRITANLHSQKTALLMEFKSFRSFLERETTQFPELRKSAEFYHNFHGKGFAGIDCFRNSHISLRTYPGVNDIVFDLFLSNEIENNNTISHTLYRRVVSFFEARILKEKLVKS
jgi:S-adenosylmethionine/arginine decarboxylase-like enzyme